MDTSFLSLSAAIVAGVVALTLVRFVLSTYPPRTRRAFRVETPLLLAATVETRAGGLPRAGYANSARRQQQTLVGSR